jgi:YaiO family outer membrane protein
LRPQVSLPAVLSILSLVVVSASAQALQLSSTEPAEEASTVQGFSDVRKLALLGDRNAALMLAERILRDNPGDVDTRLYYGIVLSWEGRYPEARRELEQVLETSPTYADARLALINVETWDGHWDRVEELSIEGRELSPTNAGFLLAEARALRNTNRPREAVEVLDELVRLKPDHREARGLRESILEDMRRWQVSTNQYYIWFSDSRSHWEERQFSLSRYTSAGSVTLGYTRTLGFGIPDELASAEIYPRIRPGTYGYAAVAYSPNAILYPRTRWAGEVFQTLPHGMEGSIGVRYFAFDQPIRLYTASLTKYVAGYWMVTARTYLSHDETGTSHSWHMMVRRYFDGPERYVGVRYGIGASPFEVRSRNDIQLLRSHTFIADLKWRFRGGWGLNVMGGLSTQGGSASPELRQYSLSAGMNYRF